MTTVWSDKVSKDEFIDPNRMDYELVWRLVQTRDSLNMPLRFSTLRGVVYHPMGDAEPPTGTSHSPMSLHKYDLPGQPLGLAQDFDTFNTDPMTGLATFEAIVGLGLWRGMGFYPNWNTKGYHVDYRPLDHFTVKYKKEGRIVWITDPAGIYHYLDSPGDRLRFLKSKWSGY